MIILLPPSEGKSPARRGKPLDPAGLSFPDLNPVRAQVMSALVDLCGADPALAMAALDLGPTQFDLVAQNRELQSAPSAPAGRVYTGVLYAALGYADFRGDDLRRANRRLRFVSALFGLLRPADRIPAYRLSGGSKLPGLGSLPGLWREPLSKVIDQERGLVVDMLSSPYSAMVALPRTAVTVKVWQEGAGGHRTAVSHFNKATKGHLAGHLATTAEAPRNGDELVDLVRADGWRAELAGSRLDVWLRD